MKLQILNIDGETKLARHSACKEIREREPRNLAVSVSVLVNYPEKSVSQTMC